MRLFIMISMHEIRKSFCKCHTETCNHFKYEVVNESGISVFSSDSIQECERIKLSMDKRDSEIKADAIAWFALQAASVISKSADSGNIISLAASAVATLRK
jgi:hypothetical protein